ncbi:hypothetical protein SKAU_G00400320 [Synaphobranchus kaupii]|uniref:Uncharacterized protein n=1 Tax=Synaphobranchus kaupii TaxID=118154 RepID=A0A9Q1IAB1_SYNKA|nr:hypothetical protein SKAU_G00400320 [Synaphobranchus kaupii]
MYTGSFSSQSGWNHSAGIVFACGEETKMGQENLCPSFLTGSHFLLCPRPKQAAAEPGQNLNAKCRAGAVEERDCREEAGEESRGRRKGEGSGHCNKGAAEKQPTPSLCSPGFGRDTQRGTRSGERERERQRLRGDGEKGNSDYRDLWKTAPSIV